MQFSARDSRHGIVAGLKAIHLVTERPFHSHIAVVNNAKPDQSVLSGETASFKSSIISKALNTLCSQLSWVYQVLSVRTTSLYGEALGDLVLMKSSRTISLANNGDEPMLPFEYGSRSINEGSQTKTAATWPNSQ